MKLKKNVIGTSVYSKVLNKQIQVNEKNAKLLLSLGFKHLFSADNKKKSTKPANDNSNGKK